MDVHRISKKIVTIPAPLFICVTATPSDGRRGPDIRDYGPARLQLPPASKAGRSCSRVALPGIRVEVVPLPAPPGIKSGAESLPRDYGSDGGRGSKLTDGIISNVLITAIMSSIRTVREQAKNIVYTL
jgi:hypothetical protein